MIPTLAPLIISLALQQGGTEGAVPAPSPDAQPETFTALRGPMGIRMNRPGRVESARAEKVEWAPQAYYGKLEVERVDKVSGPVAEGDVILVVTSVDGEFGRQVEDATRGLDFARQRRDLAEQERAMQAERAAQNVLRTSRALEIAQRSLARWDEYSRSKALELSQLGTQGQIDRLADERQELAQLEKLYEGATLDGQTRDIVLERARRSLLRSERYTHYALVDGDYFRAVEFLDQDKSVREAALNADIDARHAIQSQAIGEARAAMAAAEAAEQVEAAERLVAKLEADRAAMQVKAPISGMLGTVEEAAGQPIGGSVQFAKVFDTAHLQVPLTLPAGATRFAGVGFAVSVHFPDLPHLDCAGTITAIDPIGRAEGEGTVFGATVTLAPGSQPPPIGLAASVQVAGTLPDVLQVPAKAVRKNADGGDALHVRRGETTVEVPVVLGARQGDMVEVVSGIAPGEQVIAGGS